MATKKTLSYNSFKLLIWASNKPKTTHPKYPRTTSSSQKKADWLELFSTIRLKAKTP